MDEETLKALKDVRTPPPDRAARQRALDLAMAEFDGIRQGEKNISQTAQGTGAPGRPMSVINRIKGFIPMQARFPIAATLSGLLLLPLGVYLMQNSSLTPPDAQSPLVVSTPDVSAEAGGRGVPVEEDEGSGAVDGVTQRGDVEQTVALEERAETSADAQASAAQAVSDTLKAEPPAVAAPAPAVSVAPEAMRVRQMAGESAVTGQGMNVRPIGGVMAQPEQMLLQQMADANNDRFAAFEESPVKSVASEPVSTFSIDVDTASYAYVRRALNEGRLPVPEAVRIEELVNYFSYDYAGPQSAEEPFAPRIEIVPTPWNEATQLMRVGIKGYVPPASERAPVNLVFLIDTSGSMNSPDKLPLLKQAFALVVNQLDERDQVSIVTYAGSAGTVLEPTPASDRAKILSALENLQPGGSTAGAAGIEQAYRLAEQAGIEGGMNRVLLATDGDFNVGLSNVEDLKWFIQNKRANGTFLSILGFGTGNLNDALMQTLAQNGNGNAYYIDSFREAHKVLVEEIGSTLTTIAKDVKIQIEFNPALVAEYRLIGYETRALAREDFNNDRVDAGDIGAGHTVTALYELTPAGSENLMIDPLRYGERVVLEGGEVDVSPANSDEIGFFRLRYKAPEGDVSRLIEMPITRDLVREGLEGASNDTRFAAAVAAFGQKLRGSSYMGEMSWAEIRDLAAGARGEDANGYRAEFLSLIDLAAALSAD